MSVVLSATIMLMDLFVSVTQMTVSVTIIQLEVCAALTQVKLSATHMQVIEIMHVEVSVAIMQLVFSAVHYAHDYFYCNYAGDCFCCSYVCDSFKQQLYIPFSNWYPFFIKLTRKHQKAEDIILNLHITTLVNILRKLRYFVGRIYIKVG